MQPEAPLGPETLHVGRARIVDAHVNPTVGIKVSVDGDAIVVRFARPHRGAEARLDANSLDVRSVTTEGVKIHPDPVRAERDRVTLDGGTFIECWNETGATESTARTIAQAFNASDGMARGEPVVVSPPGADVIGAPRAVKIDGRHAVVTFEADTGGAFALFATSIESI